jgi:hypothetical protein
MVDISLREMVGQRTRFDKRFPGAVPLAEREGYIVLRVPFITRSVRRW